MPTGDAQPQSGHMAIIVEHYDGDAARVWTDAKTPEELKDVPHMPGSLEEALENLERDHEFLTRGDVFTKDAIHEWIDFKRTKELNPIRMRPTPHEFVLYFDI